MRKSDMNIVTHILNLHYGKGLSYGVISESARVSKSKGFSLVKQAVAAGIAWPLEVEGAALEVL